MLRAWIASLSDEMGSAAADPICLRMTYLAALEPRERVSFLDRAEKVTQSRLELARAYKGDPEAKQSWTFEASLRGLIYQLEARLRWLQDMRQIIDQQTS